MRSIAALVALATTVAAAQEPARPVFRSGVDLVAVDVVVLDPQGRPVTDLKAADFLVTAAGKPRKVVSAEFVPTVTAPAAAPSRPDVDPVPHSTSNSARPESRTFLFVVDVEQIASGGGMAVMHAIAGFVAGLGPDDLVGLVALPYGRPRVDLTRNRVLLRRALGQIAGAGQRRDDLMSVGEAVSIARGDRKIIDDWIERTRCGNTVAGGAPASGNPDCPQKARDLAGVILREERQRSRHLFESLAGLSRAMAPIRGLKTIVLVSEGMLRDRDTANDLRRFAEAAAAARVTLYSLVLDTPRTEAADSMTRPPDRHLDVDVKTGSMSDAASAAGGEVLLISGTADAALKRIDTQLAGYYLLSFESDPGDASDRRRTIQVKVSRANATVRARSDFSIPTAPASAPAARSKDVRARMAELIRWPVPSADIAMDLATFSASPARDEPTRRVIIVAELPPGAPPVAAGFEIVDAAGKAVADLFEAEPTIRPTPSGSTYVTAVMLAPGAYQLKFGVLTADGRRGSIEHPFQVERAAPARLRLGDIFVGVQDAAGFLPVARVRPDTGRLAVQIELQGTDAGAFDEASVVLDVVRRGEAAPLASAVMSLEGTGDALTRVAVANLTLRDVAAGEYILRATLRGGPAAGQVSRLIRLP